MLWDSNAGALNRRVDFLDKKLIHQGPGVALGIPEWWRMASSRDSAFLLELSLEVESRQHQWLSRAVQTSRRRDGYHGLACGLLETWAATPRGPRHDHRWQELGAGPWGPFAEETAGGHSMTERCGGWSLCHSFTMCYHWGKRNLLICVSVFPPVLHCLNYCSGTVDINIR